MSSNTPIASAAAPYNNDSLKTNSGALEADSNESDHPRTSFVFPVSNLAGEEIMRFRVLVDDEGNAYEYHEGPGLESVGAVGLAADSRITLETISSRLRQLLNPPEFTHIRLMLDRDGESDLDPAEGPTGSDTEMLLLPTDGPLPVPDLKQLRKRRRVAADSDLVESIQPSDTDNEAK